MAAARTLVIDTATQACSVALFEDDILVAGDFRLLGRGHAEQLIPMIGALPGKGKAEHILVNRGPGSFTGVRVGLAAAKALALAWKAPLSGYDCLTLVARQALDRLAAEDTPAEAIDCAMTGGHGEWFVQSFDGDCRPLAPLASLTPDQAAATLRATVVAGSEAEALCALRGTGRALPLHPDAREALRLSPAFRGEPASPLYGRAPDAKPAASVAVANG